MEEVDFVAVVIEARAEAVVDAAVINVTAMKGAEDTIEAGEVAGVAVGPVTGLVHPVIITTLHIGKNVTAAKRRSPTLQAVSAIVAIAANDVAAVRVTDTQLVLVRAKTFTTLGDYHSSRLNEQRM